MTETQVSPSRFDYRSARDVSALTHLFEGYLLEGFDRLGHVPSGVPFASWLNTALLYVDGEPAGFVSADRARYAIELIYVAPAYRRRGIARQLLDDLRATCPGRMHIKAPLSPRARPSPSG